MSQRELWEVGSSWMSQFRSIRLRRSALRMPRVLSALPLKCGKTPSCIVGRNNDTSSLMNKCSPITFELNLDISLDLIVAYTCKVFLGNVQNPKLHSHGSHVNTDRRNAPSTILSSSSGHPANISARSPAWYWEPRGHEQVSASLWSPRSCLKSMVNLVLQQIISGCAVIKWSRRLMLGSNHWLLFPFFDFPKERGGGARWDMFKRRWTTTNHRPIQRWHD